MKEKLTKIETRAKAFCDDIKEYGSMDIGIEWRKSKTWGHVAVILDNHNEKCSEASGCGYDKESACLVSLLVFLCPSTAHTGGIGPRAVIEGCEKDGWKLEKTASGKTFDGYRITKMNIPEPAISSQPESIGKWPESFSPSGVPNR